MLGVAHDGAVHALNEIGGRPSSPPRANRTPVVLLDQPVQLLPHVSTAAAGGSVAVSVVGAVIVAAASSVLLRCDSPFEVFDALLEHGSSHALRDCLEGVAEVQAIQPVRIHRPLVRGRCRRRRWIFVPLMLVLHGEFLFLVLLFIVRYCCGRPFLLFRSGTTSGGVGPRLGRASAAAAAPAAAPIAASAGSRAHSTTASVLTFRGSSIFVVSVSFHFFFIKSWHCGN